MPKLKSQLGFTALLRPAEHVQMRRWVQPLAEKPQGVERKRDGFTLVEVMASLAAFAISFTVASTLFTSSTGLERRGTAFRVVEQNAAFIMEFLGREVRNGAIDFEGYEDEVIDLNIMPISELKLLYRGSLTQREEVYLENGIVYVKRERPAEPGVYDTSAITDRNVIADTLNFYISPAAKCNESLPACAQPRVTVALKLRFNSEEFIGAEEFTFYFQNTFSTRIYDF